MKLKVFLLRKTNKISLLGVRFLYLLFGGSIMEQLNISDSKSKYKVYIDTGFEGFKDII